MIYINGKNRTDDVVSCRFIGMGYIKDMTTEEGNNILTVKGER